MGALAGPILGSLRRTDAYPEVDPATVGISFVDILFALAAGVVLAPTQAWASNSAKNHLSLPEVFNLGVALSVILCSFIGYHNSTNRPRFKIRFMNVSFVKFFLDISMVVVYFILAGFAAESPPSLRSVSLLVLLTFGLYLLWDFAGWYEASDARYEAAWNEAKDDPDRPDVSKPWQAMDRRRTIPTVLGLLATLIVCLYAWLTAVPPSTPTVFVVDVLLILILFAYRVRKDILWRRSRSAAKRLQAGQEFTTSH